MALVDFTISKHELSAFFRKKGHKHYRECQEQILRNFLHGIQIEYRDKTDLESLRGSETKQDDEQENEQGDENHTN